MPNWVTHNVTVVGPKEDLRRLKEDYVVRTPEGGLMLDFNRVIPMPEALEGEAGERQVEGVFEIPVPASYEWRVRRWGTKWNSTDLRWRKAPAGKLRFTFDTAWGTPEPVFVELSRVFPRLLFNVAAFDEGWMYACAGEFQDGESTYLCGEATPELYRAVFGRKP